MTIPDRGADSLFITLEGGEGAGKTTQIDLMKNHLETEGYQVVLTREPGGTKDAEMLRGLILDPAYDWDPMEQLLLFNTARHQHWRQVIAPALDRGAVVICDRYMDSTMAYQGAAGGIRADDISRLHALVFAGGAKPDLTLFIDVPVDVALERRAKRDGAVDRDRFEAADLSFHEALRRGFQDIAANDPGRVRTIDGSRAADDVFSDILQAVMERLDHG